MTVIVVSTGKAWNIAYIPLYLKNRNKKKYTSTLKQVILSNMVEIKLKLNHHLKHISFADSGYIFNNKLKSGIIHIPLKKIY